MHQTNVNSLLQEPPKRLDLLPSHPKLLYDAKLSLNATEAVENVEDLVKDENKFKACRLVFIS